MKVEVSDYFYWFTEEINRFRDLERQTSGYAAAILVFVASWASDPTRNEFIVTYRFWLVLLLVGAWIYCFWSEHHIHSRLNDYRAARDALMKGFEPGEALSKKGKFLTSLTDAKYYVSFQLINGGATILAILAVVKAHFH